MSLVERLGIVGAILGLALAAWALQWISAVSLGLVAVLVASMCLLIVTGGWERWEGVIRRRERGTSLAFFRIACGVCVLVSIGTVLTDGVWDVAWVASSDGGYQTLRGGWLIQALGGPTRSVIWRCSWIALLGGGLLVVGLGGRLTALVTLQFFGAVVDVNPHAGGSYDELLSNALWLLVLGRTTATWSLDARVMHGSWRTDIPVASWVRYLAIYQIMLCYWTTGIQKVSAYWVPGGDFSALYYILQQPSWHRGDMTWLAWIFPLTQVGTAVSWLWEFIAPLVLLAFVWPRTRGPVRAVYAGVGLLFHGLLFFIMNVGPFSIISLAYYFTFWSPTEYDGIRERAQRWLGRVRRARE